MQYVKALISITHSSQAAEGIQSGFIKQSPAIGGARWLQCD
jgi:hypothetical protein